MKKISNFCSNFLKKAEKEIIVYRGLSPSRTKRFLGEHFSSDEKFSGMFGEVSTYNLKLKKVLDLTNPSNIKKYFDEDMVRYFQLGDFWKMQTDKDGFNITPINEVVSFAQKHNFSIVKYIENFSSNVKPVNYLVLDNSLYKKVM